MMLRPLGLVVVAALAAGCGADPPVLEVGRVGYAAEEVAGLDSARLALLADLTALGLAVADGRVDSLGAAVVERQAGRARLDAMPLLLGARAAGLGEPELRAAYAAAPEWELEVRHLVRVVPRWAGAAERREARAAAEAAQRRAAAGEAFAALAAEYSEEPGAAERGGLLSPGREGDWVAPFWAAALALLPGEVSPVVETEYGYHVLRLDARRAVPYAEADQARLLAAVVAPSRARLAMESWAATAPQPIVEPPAVLGARRMLQAGRAPDSPVLARGSAWSYTAWTLAVGLAAAPDEERQRLARADDAGFGRWVEGDVREVAWIAEAGHMGVPVPRAARAAALREWQRRVNGLGAAFGFRAGMASAALKQAALRGLGATGQEAAIARGELPPLRPLLRRAYPAPGAASAD